MVETLGLNLVFQFFVDFFIFDDCLEFSMVCWDAWIGVRSWK